MKNAMIVPLVLLTTSLVFMGIAGWLFYQQKLLENRGMTAIGTVTRLVASTDSDGTTYAPVFEFKTQGGRTFEIQSDSYSSPPAYEVGQRVTIIYDPEKPSNAQIDGQNTLLVIIFAIVGGLDFIMSLLFGLNILKIHKQSE